MYIKWTRLSLVFKIGVLVSIASIVGLLLYCLPTSSNNNQESSANCSPNISESNDVEVNCSTIITRGISAHNDESEKNTLSKIPIKYFSERVDGSLYSKLKADINGNQYLILDEHDELCLSVYDERDYDGNGSTDALVQNIIACGGNCCGNSFFFVSYLGEGNFQISKYFGYSWEDPKIEEWKGVTSVLITDLNEGVNQNNPKEITVRYVLDSDNVVKVEESERKGLVALEEIKSSDFDFNKIDEFRSIEFDLNSDGITDYIIGKLWHRWGRIIWTIDLSSSEKEIAPKVPCKRIGILSTKTGNYNNIVCDHDDVLHWDGNTYIQEKTPF